jgi:serine/threonine-protein kinase
VFSPNGKWLAYESNDSGSDEVYILPFPGPGRRWQVSAGGGTIPRWNANGEELFYRNGDKMMVVPVETEGDLRLGNSRLLFEKPAVYAGEYDVMPDGQSFVMIDDSEAALPPTQLILVQNWAETLKRLVPTDN